MHSSGHSTPTWVQDAVFYQIFPDRFAVDTSVPKPANLEPWGSPPTYNGFKGGDLVGIVDHLDYLQDLGISALYLNPIFTSTANHRYHTHDYFHVDPILGGDAAFDRLLDAVHERNMRVVLDGVFNHASRGFYQFNHLLENGAQSPYLDWFSVNSWPLHPYGPSGEPPGYAAWWGDAALPKFNTATQAVREFLWEVGEYWVRRGIDGWRLDVPNEIDDDDFWREFRRRIKAVNSDVYIVGEIWGDARRWLAGDQFDGVMNYLFTRACLGWLSHTGAGVNQEVLRGTGLEGIAELDARSFATAIDALLAAYPWQATLSQLNLLGSHDTPRFLTASCSDQTSYRLATFFQMTFPGAPCLYYGDEIDMQGGRDPECRGAFNWDSASWNADVRDYVRRMTAMRHEIPALRLGTFTARFAEEHMYVFTRELADEVVIVAINAGQETSACSSPYDVPLELTQSLGDPVSFRRDGDRVVDLKVPARSGAALRGRRLDAGRA